jgi:hypothetical protein
LNVNQARYPDALLPAREEFTGVGDRVICGR